MIALRAPAVAARGSGEVRSVELLRRAVQRRKVRHWPVIMTLLMLVALLVLVMPNLR